MINYESLPGPRFLVRSILSELKYPGDLTKLLDLMIRYTCSLHGSDPNTSENILYEVKLMLESLGCTKTLEMLDNVLKASE